ncbi:MAG TPA: glycosyl hydrolase family 8, partial [bacterium]|nr:glycosyl hydrolase family 8 [bacterium]
MAYIEDILHNDVRTEGISYGMMIAVQLDKKAEFDRLWRWAKTFMQHQEGPSKGFFAWHCTPEGEKLSVSAASDGEEWIVTALFFASHRWGDGPGILNYRAEAQAILDAMLSKEPESSLQAVITNMFSREHKQVVFVPNGEADGFTDPSYHLPHYYELWARWADKENEFWREAAIISRAFLKKAAHPGTGLTPDYANFDGTATDAPWGGGHDAFRFDAWRTAMNVAVDWIWFARDEWAIEQSNRLLDFFHSEGLERYANQYTLDGKPLSAERSPGLIAMNSVAALAATTPLRTAFVRAVWEQPVPDGPGRYYDGLLHMLALLQLSGNFRIYAP